MNTRNKYNAFADGALRISCETDLRCFCPIHATEALVQAHVECLRHFR